MNKIEVAETGDQSLVAGVDNDINNYLEHFNTKDAVASVVKE